MAILDVWNNPLGITVVAAVGYRQNTDEFPHDLYSFLLSSIREADQLDVGLIYRWLRPMQLFFEQQYSAIESLYNLYSPENCPSEYLDHLRRIVGIDDELSYIWSYLSETEKRIFIKYFVRFIQYRGSDVGVIDIVETMSGLPAILQGYFFYRWIISGDEELYMETAIGRENEPGDPWLISEHEVPMGEHPDSVSLLTNPITSLQYYQFDVSTLVSLVTNPPIPELVYVRSRFTGETYIGNLRLVGGNYIVYFGDEEFFGQSILSLSTTVSHFQVGFEADQYVSDLIVQDSGSLNHDMIRGIVRFSRPMSERIYIRYYLLVEEFRNEDNWTVDSGTVVYDEEEKTVLLSDPVSVSAYSLTLGGADDWVDYGLTVKGQSGVNELYSEIRFMNQSATDYYYLRFTPHTPPAVLAGTIEVARIVGGVYTSLGTAYTLSLDIDVDYVWRIECFTSARPGGDYQIIRVYQDENLLLDISEAVPWVVVEGNIILVAEATGEWLVKQVLVHPIPLESDYVGPTV